MNLLQVFPNLNLEGHRVTSPATEKYNCISWAAGVHDDWWWPDSDNDHYWPAGIQREVTLDAFIAAFATLGYFRCDSPELEVGFEKVAIYCIDLVPKHMARQLLDGRWTSKLGRFLDIEHSLGFRGKVRDG